MNNADMPAMPQDANWKTDMEAHLNSTAGAPSLDGIGLTKREELAGRAMQGLCVNTGRNGYNNPEEIATQSVKIADALLKALSHQEGE